MGFVSCLAECVVGAAVSVASVLLDPAWLLGGRSPGRIRFSDEDLATQSSIRARSPVLSGHAALVELPPQAGRCNVEVSGGIV